MSHAETTLDPNDPPAFVDPPAASWLPLTAGDRAQDRGGAPEHGWPASIFIFLSNLAAIGLGAGAVFTVLGSLLSLLEGDWQFTGGLVLLSAVLGLGCVVQRTLAQHVKHFSRWGWYGVMIELAFLTLSKVSVLLTEPEAAGGAIVGIIIDLLWMGYFWNRRADFDVDIGG